MKETKTIKVGIDVDEPRVRSQFEGEQRRTGWRVVKYDAVPGELAYTVTLERGRRLKGGGHADQRVATLQQIAFE
jgi:hypothetical protein